MHNYVTKETKTISVLFNRFQDPNTGNLDYDLLYLSTIDMIQIQNNQTNKNIET